MATAGNPAQQSHHELYEDAVFPPEALLPTEGCHDRSIRTFFLLGDPATDFPADLSWLAAACTVKRCRTSVESAFRTAAQTGEGVFSGDR